MEARTEFRSCLSDLESVYYHHMLHFVLVINPVLWLFFLASVCMDCWINIKLQAKFIFVTTFFVLLLEFCTRSIVLVVCLTIVGSKHKECL